MLAASCSLLGLVGVLVRRNVLFMLMSIEIMLNAAGLAFVWPAPLGQPDGQVMFLFILAWPPPRSPSGWRWCCGSTTSSRRSTPTPPSEMRG